MVVRAASLWLSFSWPADSQAAVDAADPDVAAGRSLFHAIGCAKCHVAGQRTRADATLAEQSSQQIWPYTDLLLHDLGEGLADSRPEGTASGREWRTAPLWGIGLTGTVSGRARYLHDGRAKTLHDVLTTCNAGDKHGTTSHLKPAEIDDLVAFLKALPYELPPDETPNSVPFRLKK